jgi:DNA-binding GntR family transcriptional regulator
MRAGLECFSVRLACERITPEEIDALRRHQETGESALSHQDMEAYRVYNQELHAAIMRAAKNSQLPLVIGQISLKTQMLSAQTIRLGRQELAMQEHRRLVELIAARDAGRAEELMHRHVLGALEDILRHGVE